MGHHSEPNPANYCTTNESVAASHLLSKGTSSRSVLFQETEMKLDFEQIQEWIKDNALAFLIGYTLATGELHIIIADLMGLY